MAANTNPIFVLTPHSEGNTFVNADSTNKKTLFTPGSFGSRIDGIFISTDDTSVENFAFYMTIGGTDYYIGNVNVPAGSGYTTVVRVDALTTLAPGYAGGLFLASGVLLKANSVAAVTSGKTATIVVVGGDF